MSPIAQEAQKARLLLLILLGLALILSFAGSSHAQALLGLLGRF
jgi:putative copper export protein